MHTFAYAFKEGDLLLDVDSGRQAEYVIRVRDMPPEEKPREKMLKAGPGALSVPELMAVVLSNGTKKEEVLTMAHRVVKEYGEKILSRHVDAKDMAEELGIPLVRAMQIVAVSELGRRFYEKNTGGLAVVRTARDAYEHLKDMSQHSKEHVRGIYLNTHHQVIHDEIVTIGTVNSNLIHPREVFKPALQHGAAAVIIAHNHPSGVLMASDSDKEVTRQLVEAGKVLGIHLIDHLIIGKDGFISIDIDYNA